MLGKFLILEIRHPWCWIAKRYPRYTQDVEAAVILEVSDALPCKLKGLIVCYFLLIIPLCAWKKQSCYQWNLEFVEIEYFQDWPKINYGVKNVAFFFLLVIQHRWKALKLLVITLWSHVFLLIKHPVGECDIIGFLDLEILKWLVQQRRGNSSRVMV